MKRALCTIALALMVPAQAKAMTAQTAIRRVFGASRIAHCIAWHESHYNRGAVSPSADYGLFQINGPTWFGHVIRYGRRVMFVQRLWIFDPLYNARVAYIISRGGHDWRPWTTLRYCR